jgi:8-oxo-dGTP pyrophosphatase MutT (NUDIX family)
LTKQFRITEEKQLLRQFGSLCFKRKKQGIKILLITSRDTGRWVIPKGWPIKKLGDDGTALQEAWEEAGVIGKVANKNVGSYIYTKLMDSGLTADCRVEVYPIEVERLKENFPEKSQRLRRWFSVSGAASNVDEPELRDIINSFGKKLEQG